ncbi:hypothetical protein FIV07_25805 [Mycobacterium sp. THAF192]|nr:hypothetical protein FIV07_25805 [Mycobacterium sp. THAF192]
MADEDYLCRFRGEFGYKSAVGQLVSLQRSRMRWAGGTDLAVAVAAAVAGRMPAAAAQPLKAVSVCRGLWTRGVTPDVIQDIEQKMAINGIGTQAAVENIAAMCPDLWPQIIAAGW